MSKKILLVRHAKSDWADSSLKDFDRPLNARGLRDAPEMAHRIKVENLEPQKIVSSPAIRAFQTSKVMADTWGIKSDEIELVSAIYEASTSSLLKIVNEFDDEYDYIALCGHNNGITDFAAYLTDADIYNIPTCGMVLIQFPFDSWKMASKYTGAVVRYDYPKSEY